MRDGRKEVVTRFHIRLLVLVREQEGVFFYAIWRQAALPAGRRDRVAKKD